MGLSLEELREVVRGEDARSLRRREWRSTADPEARSRSLDEASADVDRLLEPVARRREELETLERELLDRRDRVHAAETA